MKVCNKCKKKVANKTKICPSCGADVSKAKIIASNTGVKKKAIVTKNEIVEEKKVLESEPKLETVVEEKAVKNTSKQVKNGNKKANVKQSSTKSTGKKVNKAENKSKQVVNKTVKV